MVSTTKFPGVVGNHNDRSPHWTNPEYVEDNDLSSVSEGDSGADGYPHASATLSRSGYSDGLRSTEYDFTIPDNARVDGVICKVQRSGAYIRDYSVKLLVYNPSTGGTQVLADQRKLLNRTDNLFKVDTYGGSTYLWGASELTPEQINHTSTGMLWTGYNNSSSTRAAWLHGLALTVYYTDPTYTITSTLPDVALQGTTIQYNLTITSTNSIDQGVAIPVESAFPAGLSLVDATTTDGSCSITEVGGVESVIWDAVLNESYEAVCSVTVECTGTGNQSNVTSELDYSTTDTSVCNILTTDPGDIYYATALIDDTGTLANMVNGETYTISVYSKVHDTGYSGIYEGIKNNRIAVVNGSEVTGSRVTAQDTYQRVSVSFVYDNTEPLTLKLYGQYESVSTVPDDYWAGLALKAGTDTTYSEAGNLLADPEALLSEVTPTILPLPAGDESPEYRFTFPAAVINEADYIITGLSLGLDCEDTTGLSVGVDVENSTGTPGDSTSGAYTTEYTNITFGGENDLWGLTTTDIMGEDLTFTLTFSNTTAGEITPAFTNLTLTVHYIVDETYGNLGFTYNGEHSSTYQLYLISQDVPSGPGRDIETLTLNGMDGELIIGQRLTRKEIKLGFRLWGDDVEDTMNRLDAVTQWLSNDRNEYGIPTPKSLIFDWDPDREYLAVLSDSLEVENIYSTVECTATFIIPQGVALSTFPVVTGAVGSTDSLIRVYPTITVLADGSASIILKDDETGQTLTLDATVTSGKIVSFNCEKRTVTDSTPTDLTGDVALDSQWFNFTGDYNLTCTGGTIQSVSYYEGT